MTNTHRLSLIVPGEYGVNTTDHPSEEAARAELVALINKFNYSRDTKHEAGRDGYELYTRATSFGGRIWAKVEKISDIKGRCECGHRWEQHEDEPWPVRTKGGYGKTTWKRYCHGNHGYATGIGETPCRCKGYRQRPADDDN